MLMAIYFVLVALEEALALAAVGFPLVVVLDLTAGFFAGRVAVLFAAPRLAVVAFLPAAVRFLVATDFLDAEVYFAVRAEAA